MVLATIGLFLGACILLVISGWLLVKSLSKISVFLRINEFIAAFILMAFCTSLPELFVGISSALAGKPTISLGNVIGSNIVDLTLIAGIVILLARGIRIERKIIPREVFGMVFLTALPVVLMYFGKELSRLDGLILLGAFAIYMYEMVTSKHAQYEKQPADHVPHWIALLMFVLFVVCAVGLYFSSKMVVHYGVELARMLELPPIVIGLFFVAIGTSLPDLTFSARAVLAKHAPLAIGDLVGAVVVNSTVVLAVTALINPITNSFFLFVTSAAFMIAITFLFATFIESGDKLTWKEGVSLILFYVVFVIVELNLQRYFG
ncbi:MAG: sodium:calcium antiporter [Candidatus Woesearchaeota archaeon]